MTAQSDKKRNVCYTIGTWLIEDYHSSHLLEVLLLCKLHETCGKVNSLRALCSGHLFFSTNVPASREMGSGILCAQGKEDSGY